MGDAHEQEDQRTRTERPSQHLQGRKGLRRAGAGEGRFRHRARVPQEAPGPRKVSVKLVKNTFAKKVLGENGVAVENVWSGPTLLCWGGDSVKGLANSVDGAMKDSKKDPKAPDKFKVKTAIADGQIISLELAKKIPTRAEAIGSVVGAILGPGASLARGHQGPRRNNGEHRESRGTQSPQRRGRLIYNRDALRIAFNPNYYARRDASPGTT